MAQMTEEDIKRGSEQVWAQVEAHSQFRESSTVLMYWSMPDEVYTHDFIKRWHGKKKIVLPVITGNQLRLALFEGEQSLKRNAAMNIYEPKGDDFILPQKIEIAIVPGVAFDQNNNRIGRGKGYYDRLLPQLNAYNLGVCFDFQIFENIPSEKHDVAMNMVVLNR